MAATPKAVAIYARISSDQEGTALGVQRQLKDCQRLAADLGWTVAEEYVDNDFSAYSGKRRPSYERMLGDLSDGLRDAVIVYHADRLTRRPVELEHFVEVVAKAGVRHVRFVAGGDVDIANGDGLMVLRLLAAVAANESATKGRRVKRKLEEIALAGRPHGGGRWRPFGYDADRVTLRADEAEIVRAIAARYLAGESYRSIAAWLDEAGVRTVAGVPWTTTTLRSLLRNPRIAGLREHNGVIVGKAVWDPIITERDHSRILARMAERKASGRRAPRRYLLSGLLRCGRCGNRLFTAARGDRRRYVCTSGPDHGGCGGITVTAARVEELVADAVLYRLDTQEMRDALSGRVATDADTAALADSIASDREQLDELAQLFAEKQIASREWLKARKLIEARINDAERRLARLTNSDTLAGLVGNGAALRDQWAGLNLDRQHAIVAAVLDHAVINPATGGQGFDHRRVELLWRV